MMKTIKTLLTAVLALVALAGCRNEEQEAPEATSLKTVRFRAGAAESRTAFTEAVDGVYQTLWTENDRDVLLSLNYGKAEASAVSPSEDGTTASFEATFNASSATAPYTFYAVSPASGARAISPSRSAWSIYIAAEQTPLATSVDEAAQLLVAKSAASATLPDEVNLHFSHLTAYGRITLKDLSLDGAAVTKVELTFSTPVVGEWYWGEDGTLTDNGGSHTITLRTDASGDLWFACAPVDVSGATMTLSILTDRGVATKKIIFPEGRKFSSGKVARFSVDMAGIELTGETDSDPLAACTEFGSYVSEAQRTYVRGSDQILRSDNGGQYSFVLLNAAEKEQLVISGYDPTLVKGDEVDVKVSWRKGLQVLLKGQSYHLQVVKEDGSKVWLGDGSGQGFIIRK
jgi:hypothetical protein